MPRVTTAIEKSLTTFEEVAASNVPCWVLTSSTVRPRLVHATNYTGGEWVFFRVIIIICWWLCCRYNNFYLIELVFEIGGGGGDL